MTTINDLINLLSTERTPVQKLWKVLGVTPRGFKVLCETYRDDMATAGIQLHSATHAQTSNKALSVMINGEYIQALSKPESGVVAYIAKYLDTMHATADELAQIRAKIDQLAAQLAPPHLVDDLAKAPHITYRQEMVGANGPYWYAYWRENGKLRKKYIGKERPIATDNLH
jgi:hypothetical protein